MVKVSGSADVGCLENKLGVQWEQPGGISLLLNLPQAADLSYQEEKALACGVGNKVPSIRVCIVTPVSCLVSPAGIGICFLFLCAVVIIR